MYPVVSYSIFQAVSVPPAVQVKSADVVVKLDEVSAVGGIHEMWAGVGEGWVILSKHAPKWKLSLARYAKTLFSSILATTSLHRVQASIHMGDPEAIRFARWMGFEDEGIMYKFGPDGSDYYRMARVL